MASGESGWGFAVRLVVRSGAHIPTPDDVGRSVCFLSSAQATPKPGHPMERWRGVAAVVRGYRFPSRAVRRAMKRKTSRPTLACTNSLHSVGGPRAGEICGRSIVSGRSHPGLCLRVTALEPYLRASSGTRMARVHWPVSTSARSGGTPSRRASLESPL